MTIFSIIFIPFRILCTFSIMYWPLLPLLTEFNNILSEIISKWCNASQMRIHEVRPMSCVYAVLSAWTTPRSINTVWSELSSILRILLFLILILVFVKQLPVAARPHAAHCANVLRNNTHSDWGRVTMRYSDTHSISSECVWLLAIWELFHFHFAPFSRTWPLFLNGRCASFGCCCRCYLCVKSPAPISVSVVYISLSLSLYIYDAYTAALRIHAGLC